MPRRLPLIFAVSLALAGCNPASKGEVTSDDSHNPHYKQAQQDLDAGNPSAAAADYEAALAENPNLAEAHYELGILYGDKLNDPIASIYHFKRYLELAPNSDKAGQVKEEIDKQGQAFAASLPNVSGTGAAGGDVARLQADNAVLKKQLADATHTISQLQTQLAKHHGHLAMQGTPPPTPVSGNALLLADTSASNAPAAGAAANGTESPASTPTTVAPATPPRAVAVDTNAPNVAATPPTSGTNGAPSGPSRTYTVVKGDSIWKIAHKMYPGDTKNGEDKIRDANKDALNGKFLQPGQVLIIPQ